MVFAASFLFGGFRIKQRLVDRLEKKTLKGSKSRINPVTGPPRESGGQKVKCFSVALLLASGARSSMSHFFGVAAITTDGHPAKALDINTFIEQVARGMIRVRPHDSTVKMIASHLTTSNFKRTGVAHSVEHR